MQLEKLGAYSQFELSAQGFAAATDGNLQVTDAGNTGLHLAGHDIHPGTTDEISDERVPGVFEKILRGADLQHLPFVHDHDLVGKSQCLQLIVSDVNHGQVKTSVNLFKLAAQEQFQVWIDDC